MDAPALGTEERSLDVEPERLRAPVAGRRTGGQDRPGRLDGRGRCGHDRRQEGRDAMPRDRAADVPDRRWVGCDVVPSRSVDLQVDEARRHDQAIRVDRPSP